jgi:Restriction endonuclease NotI
MEKAQDLPKQPLAEVFGYPIDNFSQAAERHRRLHLCPFNNKVPNCTKSRVENPIGVCSVYDASQTATVTCPIRFREDWYIVEHAASFFFPQGVNFTSLTEVRLNDKYGKSAGDIDIVLVSYDDVGRLKDFGSLEVQAVYTSGTISAPFKHYIADPAKNANLDWRRHKNYPRPDYLSSSRKRLAPQLIYKGGILHAWKKKMAVAVDSQFFATLPSMEEVDRDEAELAWIVYDLKHDITENRRYLTLARTVYTRFIPTLDKITKSEPGEVQEFVDFLQSKLNGVLAMGSGIGNTPDTASLQDIVETIE